MENQSNTINVLDKGFVTLVDHLGSDLRTVNAARISFGKQKDSLDEKDEQLINYLGEHMHHAPARHNYVTLHVKAPIFVLRQWMKHSHVSSDFNEISGRYTEAGQDEYFIPDSFRVQATVNKQGSDGPLGTSDQIAATELYLNACKTSMGSYREMLALGVCREQARCVLPLALYSELYWTCGLQVLANFLALREDAHAQREIREYAYAIHKLVEPLFPHTLRSLINNHPINLMHR